MFSFLLALFLIPISSAQVGSHRRGYLTNARELPAKGDGFIRLAPHKRYSWGTRSMISLIKKVSNEMDTLYPNKDRLQIGDISSQRGGRLRRHASHQNGLDADISYYRLNGKEQSLRGGGFRERMVVRGQLSRNFDVFRNWELMKSIHKLGRVERVFVDRRIKREFCRFAIKNGEHQIYSEVLRSMRPQANHSHHFHLRLRCPLNASRCRDQQSLPEGSGC